MTTRHGFSRTIIPMPEGEYMRRWVFSCPWFTVRLHNIKLSDEYRPHNHPWSFVSVLLHGKYDEERYTDKDPLMPYAVVNRRRFVPVYRHQDAYHRVIPLTKWGAVWTLVLTGPKRTDQFGDAAWWFLNEDGTRTHWTNEANNQANTAAYGSPTPEV
jgi:hypothetical protein